MNLEINFPESLVLLPVSEALLLPRSIISIKIDTPEGKASINKSLEENRLFGLVQPRFVRGNEPSIEKIGICAKIIGFEEIFVDDTSFYLLKVVGISRFFIKNFDVDDFDVVRADIDWKNFFKDIVESDAPLLFKRDVFLHLLKKYSFHMNKKILLDFENAIFKKIDFDIFEYLPNERLVDFSALSLQLPPEQRQALIEAVDYNDRALILMEIMTLDKIIANPL